MLRDTTESERINRLSCQAEVLFYRLMMKADDYGVFHANLSLIKAALFPLRLDSVRETDISRWLTECEKAGLIAFYNADNKPYMVIIDFGQRKRNMKKRFPPPPDDLPQLAATRRNSPPEEEDEIEVEREVEGESFATSLKSDQMFFEQLALGWGIDQTAYQKMIDSFGLLLNSKNKTHPNLGEFKSHFFNWGAKKYSEFKIDRQNKFLNV